MYVDLWDVISGTDIRADRFGMSSLDDWKTGIRTKGLSYVCEMPVRCAHANVYIDMIEFSQRVDSERDMEAWTYFWDSGLNLIFFHCASEEDAVYLAMMY